MKQNIQLASSTEGEESNTDSASKQLDGIDIQFGRAMRRNILNNFADPNEIPDCKQGTEINWAPSGQKNSWISTSEYPVARRLLCSSDFTPFGVVVQDSEELSGILTEHYTGGTIYAVECQTADLSANFEELLIDVLADIAGGEPHSMVLTPDQWVEEGHDE